MSNQKFDKALLVEAFIAGAAWRESAPTKPDHTLPVSALREAGDFWVNNEPMVWAAGVVVPLDYWKRTGDGSGYIEDVSAHPVTPPLERCPTCTAPARRVCKVCGFDQDSCTHGANFSWMYAGDAVAAHIVWRAPTLGEHGSGSRIAGVFATLDTAEVARRALTDTIGSYIVTHPLEGVTVPASSAIPSPTPENACMKIFDHKWLDPRCVESGCRSAPDIHRADGSLVGDPAGAAPPEGP